MLINGKFGKYHGYIGSIESDDGEKYYGKLLNTDDLVTYEGSSIAELFQCYKDAVDDYIAFCPVVEEV